MINSIGAGAGRLDTVKTAGTTSGAPVAEIGLGANSASGAPANPVTALAAAGPPIDAAKVAAVRALIAEGRYSIDPKAVADKMVELDLADPLRKDNEG